MIFVTPMRTRAAQLAYLRDKKARETELRATMEVSAEAQAFYKSRAEVAESFVEKTRLEHDEILKTMEYTAKKVENFGAPRDIAQADAEIRRGVKEVLGFDPFADEGPDFIAKALADEEP